MTLLVTGGLGFIGSAVVRRAVAAGRRVINLDAETYAAAPANVADVTGNALYTGIRVDIRDPAALETVFETHKPQAVLHLAAESHVDRSIDGPRDFIDTNITGTFNLLEVARRHGVARFHHVSTDEVFGSLGAEGRFDEATAYAPRSPYAASKAASDHLVRAWGETYGLPVVITNCSNNYGPRQFPEKLIPVVILAALEGREIPVYGAGENVRDWLYVDDHAAALLTVLDRGADGATYAIGGEAEARNIDLVTTLCALMDAARPEGAPHARLIRFVEDRPGHDARYAIDPARIRADLSWRPSVTLEEGLARTVDWYLGNRAWWEPLRARLGDKAGGRLGLGLNRGSDRGPDRAGGS